MMMPLWISTTMVMNIGSEPELGIQLVPFQAIYGKSRGDEWIHSFLWSVEVICVYYERMRTN
jgi:hypothetical protein